MGARVCPAHCFCPSYQICVCWAADTDFVPQHWAVEAELDDEEETSDKPHYGSEY